MQKFLRLGERLSEIKIGGRDIKEYNIVVHSAGSLRGVGSMPATVSKAARTLQKYIAAITDITVPIIFDLYSVHPEKEIAIGGVCRDYDVTRDDSYGDDDYRMVLKDGNLMINGGMRGVLYGVYSFLEKYLGVRFFSKTCERIAYKSVFELSDFDEGFKPTFEYRELCHWNVFDSEFTVKSKINGTFARTLREEDGYGVGFAGGFAGLVHTFSHLCPTELFETYPEYFAADSNGNRVPYALCHTNAETQKIVAENMLKWLNNEKNPTVISLSINDGVPSRCSCERCNALFGERANDTDRLLYFVNKVAARIRKKYPNVKVDTISYADTADLPNYEKPSSNVVIRVCGSYERSVSVAEAVKSDSPLLSMQRKKEFAERINGWAELTDKIYVWDYPYNYKTINAVFPVLHTLREDMRYFAEHNVKGVYINGQTDTCDFDDLKIYLLAKLLYNPYMSEEEYERHTVEFLQGYYGAGWKKLYAFIKKCEKIGKSHPFSCVADPVEVIPLKKDKNGEYDYGFINSSRKLFEEAARLAKTAGERNRIQKHSLLVDYYEVYSLMDEKMQAAEAENNSEEIEKWRLKNQKIYNAFVRHGITRVVENTFLPVVKNFEQSPVEWGYWDNECAAGDRNNDPVERELYMLLPINTDKERVDVSFLYKTNNENARGFVSVYGGLGEKINANWREYKQFKKMYFSSAPVLTKKRFSELSGIAPNDKRIELLPIHLKGVILKVERMDAGAYAFVRDIQTD